MAGRCSKVDIVLHEDNSVSIRDDGAGIPAGKHPIYDVSTLEVILTKLHSGGKFEQKAYQVSGGLHGVGLAAVCALSESFHVESYRDGKIYSQDYAEGKKANEVTIKSFGDEPTGTLIHFKPDSSIFTVSKFDYDLLAGRFKEMAYLTSKFRINFTDARETDEEGNFKSVSYYVEGGIKQFVRDITGTKGSIAPDTPIFHAVGESEGVVVEVGFTYTDEYHENIRGFVNNINTHEGGTHLTGFRRVLTSTINDFAQDFKVLKANESKLSGSDVREGIVAIISVKVPHPQFEGQTKTKLGNSEVDGIVSSTLKDPLKKYLDENQHVGKAIINKAVLARRAREAAKKARDLIRKGGGGRVALPGKLVSSRETDPMKRELYLVEGQSAGGTAVKGRDAGFQEILFLRGKVLNVEKARLNRALENAEIRNIITAIGTGILDECDLEKCRYGRIILLMDADVDGAHIATLLLTFFYRYLRPVVEDGRLYVARPPLFKVSLKGDAADLIPGKKNYRYCTNDDEYNDFIYALNAMEIEKKLITINRFKGLGEMNADQLKETTMDISDRRIDRVNIDDAIEAEEWLTKLMGSEVEDRKNFIQNDVFVETDKKSRGKFYDIAFDLDEGLDDERMSDEERELAEKEIESLFDEYEPIDRELFAALKELQHS
jgi:DNA gyrase subunit B